jgi:hypothetical protein
MRTLIERGRRARFALRPARVVLAGEVNAGKSTLFNALVGGERVLVSEAPGTTRDAILERVHLGEWPVDLVDTAGEREVEGHDGAGQVERAGQALARSFLAEADLVLWLVPPGGAAPARSGGAGSGSARLRVLGSMADRDLARPMEAGWVSAHDRAQEACEQVAEIFRTTFELPLSAWETGVGVPCDETSLRRLERAVRATGGETQRAALEELLGEPSSGPAMSAAVTRAESLGPIAGMARGE